MSTFDRNAVHESSAWFPLGLETWKNGRVFSSQGILLRLEKSGNFTQNTGKIQKITQN